MRRLRAGVYETPDGRFLVTRNGHRESSTWGVLDRKHKCHTWLYTLAEAREHIAALWRLEAAKKRRETKP